MRRRHPAADGARAAAKWFHNHGYGNAGATSGHLIPFHERALTEGWKGIHEDLQERLDASSTLQNSFLPQFRDSPIACSSVPENANRRSVQPVRSTPSQGNRAGTRRAAGRQSDAMTASRRGADRRVRHAHGGRFRQSSYREVEFCGQVVDTLLCHCHVLGEAAIARDA